MNGVNGVWMCVFGVLGVFEVKGVWVFGVKGIG